MDLNITVLCGTVVDGPNRWLDSDTNTEMATIVMRIDHDDEPRWVNVTVVDPDAHPSLPAVDERAWIAGYTETTFSKHRGMATNVYAWEVRKQPEPTNEGGTNDE